ncbi:MAG: hypothetical protein HW416_3220 [Chloroflexi bacterium]|nr:hypothetical protein [Chloroflexota bacterium]
MIYEAILRFNGLGARASWESCSLPCDCGRKLAVSVGHACLGKRRHLVEDGTRVVDQMHRHGGTGPFSQPEIEVEQRHELQTLQDHAVPDLDGVVSGDQVVAGGRA